MEEPITREEQYLANIAGDDVQIPSTPLTRIEQYLARIAQGGSSGVTDVQVNGQSVVNDGVAEITTADLDNVVIVSGTTPSITASAGTRYECGEVSTLSFTPSGTGICDVIFTSGSTPTVLTIPNTVKLPSWFDATSLDANTTYEINVLNGTLGAVMAWS